MNKPIAIKEAAELLGVDPKTLRRWESDGKISPQKNNWRANRLKSDASVREVEAILKYMRENCKQ
jgi:DNA-binding transcriptional MerR regulator